MLFRSVTCLHSDCNGILGSMVLFATSLECGHLVIIGLRCPAPGQCPRRGEIQRWSLELGAKASTLPKLFLSHSGLSSEHEHLSQQSDDAVDGRETQCTEWIHKAYVQYMEWVHQMLPMGTVQTIDAVPGMDMDTCTHTLCQLDAHSTQDEYKHYTHSN